MMQPSDAGLGDVVEVDAAVFHRAGVDGTCHVEQGVEYVLMDDPADGPAAAVLTVEQEQALAGGVAGVLYSLTLDCTSVEALEQHPSVYEFQEVREG